MKLSESIFLSLAVATFIIGVHQSFFFGVLESYWLFMLSASFLLAFRFTKTKGLNQPDADTKTSATSKPKAKPGRAIKSK